MGSIFSLSQLDLAEFQSSLNWVVSFARTRLSSSLSRPRLYVILYFLQAFQPYVRQIQVILRNYSEVIYIHYVQYI